MSKYKSSIKKTECNYGSTRAAYKIDHILLSQLNFIRNQFTPPDKTLSKVLKNTAAIPVQPVHASSQNAHGKWIVSFTTRYVLNIFDLLT